MKYTLTLVLFAISFCYLAAQPANDNCGGLINLGDAPVCPSPAIYSNLLATESNIGNDNFPNCFNGLPERDVWFQFTATAAILNYKITVTGVPDGATPAMNMPQIALYRGDCAFDELVLLECAASLVDEGQVSLVVDGLTPGLSYFLRINDWSTSATPNWGAFQLCIEENIDVTFLVNEGGSDDCEGELFDTGGPAGNYSDNENHVFSICPDQPGECIVFNLLSYNFEDTYEQLIFFDGPSTSSPQIESLGTGTFNGLFGGVCYQVVATSGCLTVQFTSDQVFNFEGFHGEWHCTNNCPDPQPLTVVPDPSVSQIEDAMDNPLMDITITGINCPDEALGVFQQGSGTNLGLDEGLLLTTGRAAEVANPASFFANTDWDLPGNPELDFLNQISGNGQNTNDACIVEADVFVKTDRLAFDYVFGSDEYKAAFSQFSNDLIGVLVSGPGIPGNPGLNNQENLATLSTGQLVQIQTVNANTNWEHYRSNLNSQTIAYNGLTAGFLGESKTLVAERQVTPCQTYHVKFAIGDTDPNDDSGLFITPSRAGLPELSVNFNTGFDYFVEGCANVPGTLQFNLPGILTAPTTFDVQIGGTATLGVDYFTALGSTVTFTPGQTSFNLPIIPILDVLPEGTETVEISLTRNYGCGEIAIATVVIEIKDALDVEIVPNEDVLFVCAGTNTAQLQAEGAASYTWSPAGIFNNPNIANPVATINMNQQVTVTGTFGTCTDTAKVFLQIISPQVNVVPAGSTQLCQGESILLTAVNNVNGAGLIWSPASSLSDPNEEAVVATPVATTTYTATVSAAGGCTSSDDITINVEPFDFPQFVAGDTTICQNSSVLLASPLSNTTTTFNWSPATGLDNPNITGATATPAQTTTYTLTATSPNGLCTETETVTVTVLPADVSIAPEKLELCLGGSAQITAVSSTGGAGLNWSPQDSLQTVNPQTVVVNPSVSTWYVATLTIGQCTVRDSVFVQVDSLPANLAIEAIPAKQSYCEGETVSLVSPNYPFQNFPEISHQWTPSIGVVSEDSLFNLVINATITTTYVRTTTSGACSAVDSIEIIVVPATEIQVTPQNPSVCAGQSVQLQATSQDIMDFQWSPSAGLSCSDCPNPVATPPGSLTYQVQGEFMGCPAYGTVTIEVLPPPVFSFPADRTICIGSSIQLNNQADPLASYVWSVNGNVVSLEAQPVFSPTETTTYSLTVDNGQCEPVTQELTITVVQDYDLALSNSDVTICQGNEIVPDANTGGVAGTLTWQPAVPNGTSVAVNENTTFIATFTDTEGCFTKQDSFTVTVSPPFTVDSLVSDSLILFEGQTIDLEAFTTPEDLSLPDFTWQVDGVTFLENTENSASTQAPDVDGLTTLVFKVIIQDEFGCMDMDTVSVQVKNSAFGMPNIFTPNGDGLNDRFFPVKSPNVVLLDFKVWNRWGKMVYNNESGDEGWDGKQGGKEALSDVYVFYLRYQEGGSVKKLEGDVTLVR